MRQRLRLALLTALALLLLTGCGDSWQYAPITDVNDLQGRRVGVNLSWEADYALTGRTDMELYRYDSISDLFMALSFNKIDAAAMDAHMWVYLSSLSEGMEKVEPAFGKAGYIMYFGPHQQALAEDFNSYLAQCRQTDYYSDFLERVRQFDGENYEEPAITLNGTGETLRVAVDVDGYPHGFLMPGDDVPTGYDMEILKRYANDRNYQLRFFSSNYQDALMGLNHGVYDIYTGYLSDVYREDVENAGLYTSDNLYETDLYFVQKTQPGISIALDELE